MSIIRDYLIDVADSYKTAAGIPEDTTVSHRVFGDTKKLAALRVGADITTSRFEAAMVWFRENWPEGVEAPPFWPPPMSEAISRTDQPVEKTGVQP